MTEWDYIKTVNKLPPIEVETSETPPKTNCDGDMKEVIKQLKYIAQELNTLNRILRQRR